MNLNQYLIVLIATLGCLNWVQSEKYSKQRIRRMQKPVAAQRSLQLMMRPKTKHNAKKTPKGVQGGANVIPKVPGSNGDPKGPKGQGTPSARQPTGNTNRNPQGTPSARQPTGNTNRNPNQNVAKNSTSTNNFGNRKKCKLCSDSWSVPNPQLVLMDKKCSHWNARDMPAENCQNVQATFGGACQCSNAPKPVCDVCPNGNYIWYEKTRYNTFTDDFCTRMIYKMSKRTQYCEGNKERVAKMCCSDKVLDAAKQNPANVHNKHAKAVKTPKARPGATTRTRTNRPGSRGYKTEGDVDPSIQNNNGRGYRYYYYG